jgi:uncharacterized membrane protein YhhN
MMPATIAASAGFVLAGFSRGLPKAPSGYLGIFGLLFCAAGDVLGPGNFLVGAGAFLLAHVCFIGSYVLRGVRPTHVAMASAVLAVAMVLVVILIGRHVPNPNELSFVLIYWTALSAMLATAWGIAPADWYLRWGSLIFYLSDLFVARWRYLDSSPINGFFCYPLYYTACLLLGFAIARHIGATRERPVSG